MRGVLGLMVHQSANRKDSPALCTLFGIILTVLAVTLLYGWRFNVADRAELLQISGRVEAFNTTNLPKAGPKLHIYLRDARRLRHLTQDDLRSDVPRIRRLRIGDTVSALAKPDFFGRDLDWLWELHRENETLLTYDQTLHFLQKEAERLRPMGYGTACAAALLFGASGLLRRHFGAWSSAS